MNFKNHKNMFANYFFFLSNLLIKVFMSGGAINA